MTLLFLRYLVLQINEMFVKAYVGVLADIFVEGNRFLGK